MLSHSASLLITWAFYCLTSSQEGWAQYSKMFWEKERPHSCNIYYSIFLCCCILLILIVVNLLLCLTYKLIFIIVCTYIGRNIVYIGLDICGFGYPLGLVGGSWNVSPWRKGSYCSCVIAFMLSKSLAKHCHHKNVHLYFLLFLLFSLKKKKLSRPYGVY